MPQSQSPPFLVHCHYFGRALSCAVRVRGQRRGAAAKDRHSTREQTARKEWRKPPRGWVFFSSPLSSLGEALPVLQVRPPRVRPHGPPGSGGGRVRWGGWGVSCAGVPMTPRAAAVVGLGVVAAALHRADVLGPVVEIGVVGLLLLAAGLLVAVLLLFTLLFLSFFLSLSFFPFSFAAANSSGESGRGDGGEERRRLLRCCQGCCLGMDTI